MKPMQYQETLFTFQEAGRYKRKRYKRPRSKKLRYFLGICLLLLFVLSTALSSIGYLVFDNSYQQYLSLAQAGERDLQLATASMQTISHDPFNIKALNDAQHNFTSALAAFNQLHDDLASLPGALTTLPIYGARLHAAMHLIPLAIEVAQGGLVGCTIVRTIASRFHDPLNTKSHGLTTTDMTLLKQKLQQLKIILNQAVQQTKQLRPEDLQVDPGVNKIVREIHDRIPLIQQVIDETEAFFAVAPALLGVDKPAYYLVEILDSTELRPGGGFIGNYGIASFVGGRLISVHVMDTYLLDRAFERAHQIPFPPAYSWFTLSPGTWGLRDSNLDADFPTSARNGEIHYKEEGGTLPLTGVIAITPTLIEHMLTLTGPIDIPEYRETVTAQNLIDRIHYHQLIEEGNAGNVPSADGYSSTRKHFTALLGEHLLARVHSLPGSVLPKLLQVLSDSMHTKDLQIYFNSQAAEKILSFYHFDDSIHSTTGDGIFVVDANITPSKVNKYLITTVNDQVTLDNAGNATHRTLITFTWTRPGLNGRDFYGSTRYNDYVRVYVPHSGVLLSQAGWLPNDTGITFGRKFWGGYFHVDYPSMGTITLTWRVAGTVQKDTTHGWNYPYLIQHQAGAQQKINLQVAFPSCATIVNKSTGIVADSKQHVHLTQALTQDTEVSIGYMC